MHYMSDYTPEQLREFLKSAYSYENRGAHDKQHLRAEMVGTLQLRGRIYDIYLDEEHNPWYSVRIMTATGPISEYQHIFGRREPRKREREQIR